MFQHDNLLSLLLRLLLAGGSPKLAALLAQNGPLDRFVCFAKRS